MRFSRRSFLQRVMVALVGGGLAAGTPSAQGRSPAKPTGPVSRSMYYRKREKNLLQCELCFRQCLIPDGKRGFCRARINKAGKLESLVWGRPAGLQIDPIELEPMYHLVPGHRNLCVYTASCNFRCKHCHNWSISQSAPEEIKGLSMTPREIVEETIRLGCQSISHSINEPTVFYEMMYEVSQIAKERGLMTVCHTNGGIAEGPLKALLKYLDGVTVDLKSFNPKFYREVSEARLEPVLNTLVKIKESATHLEIVNLVITTLNDDLQEIKKMCRWIVENLGKEVPLHFTRFSPAYKMTHLPPTPLKTLESAWSIAVAEGIKYVYIGNVVGHPGNSTYCPKCSKMLIERTHFLVLKNLVQQGSCPFCQERITGIWTPP